MTWETAGPVACGVAFGLAVVMWVDACRIYRAVFRDPDADPLEELAPPLERQPGAPLAELHPVNGLDLQFVGSEAARYAILGGSDANDDDDQIVASWENGVVLSAPTREWRRWFAQSPPPKVPRER